jgi:tetratricopeptide (TPR) repeat protein
MVCCSLPEKLPIHQGDVRLDASLGNSAYFAVYLLIHIFHRSVYCCISAIRYSQLIQINQKQKQLSAEYLLFQVIILFYTGTRGSILGLLGGLAVAAVLLHSFERENKKMRMASGIVVVAVVAPYLGFIAVKNTSFVKNNVVLSRFASISLNDKTTQSRFILWNMAFQGFKEHPILGWGQENFNYVFNKYYDARLYANEQWFDRTHNVISSTGSLPAVFSVCRILGIFRRNHLVYLVRPPRMSVTEKSILTGLLVAYFIHNFFVFDNLVSYIFYFALAAYVQARRRTVMENPVCMSIAKIKLLLRLRLLLPFLSLLRKCSSNQANTTLIQAITPRQDLNENLDLFKKTLRTIRSADPEVREQLISLTSQVVNAAMTQQNPTLIQSATSFLDLATQESKIKLSRTPNDARYYILPGAMLSRVGQTDQAIEYLKKGVELTPHKQAAIFELAVAYIQKGDTKSASIFSREPMNLSQAMKKLDSCMQLARFTTSKMPLPRIS